MAHGLPNGFVRLFDENGNPVDVVLTSDGKYALAVRDPGTFAALQELLARESSTSDQGAPADVSDAWPIRLTDGTFIAPIKPPNTPATAADPALVVAMSPGSPIAVLGPVAVTQSGAPWSVTGIVAIAGTPPAGSTIPPIDANLIDGTEILVDQGIPADTSDAWPFRLTDGSNLAAIKPASTPAVAQDPALVVAVSPNSPVTVAGVVQTAQVGPSSVNVLSAPTLSVAETPGSPLMDLFTDILTELRIIRAAQVYQATEGGRVRPEDLDPTKQDFTQPSLN